MAKWIAALLPTLFSLAAFAQSTPEAPSPQASPVTIIIFIALFVAGCVGYIGFTWWRGRNEKEAGDE